MAKEMMCGMDKWDADRQAYLQEEEIAAAVAAESERCAKIVESWKETPGLHNMLDSIAAAIRKGE